MKTNAWFRTAWFDQRGSIYLAAIMGTLVMTFLGLVLFDLIAVDTRLTAGTRNDARALYAAETGLSQAFLAYAGGTRPWPGGNDTPFADQSLSYDSAVARFTVTASPTGTPDQLLVVSTGCAPKPAASGACPEPSGWAKVQTTVQRVSTPGPPTTTTTNIGFPYGLAGGSGALGGQGTVSGDIYINGDISQLNATVLGKVTSATGNITGGGQSDVRGNAQAGGSISTINHPVSGTNIPNTPSPQIVFPPVPPCNVPTASGGLGMGYSSFIPHSGSGSWNYDPATGDLTVSGNVTITAGTYCINSFTVSSHATVQVSGQTILYVTGQIDVTSQSILNSTHSAVNLQIYSSAGTDPATLTTTIACTATPPVAAGFSLAAHSTADVLLYAPCAPVDMSTPSSVVNGSVVGRSVDVQGHGTLTYDTSLGGTNFVFQLQRQTTTPGPSVTQYSLGSGSWCQYRSRGAATCP